MFCNVANRIEFTFASDFVDVSLVVMSSQNPIWLNPRSTMCELHVVEYQMAAMSELRQLILCWRSLYD